MHWACISTKLVYIWLQQIKHENAMPKSMTGFSRLQQPSPQSLLCWEIKAVNHRYLELSFRLPESLRCLENEFRAKARAQIKRGKVECQLKLLTEPSQGPIVCFNENLLDLLIQAGEELAARKGIPNDLKASQVLAWPGVLTLTPPLDEEMTALALMSFEQSLSAFNAAREREGEALKTTLLALLADLFNFIEKAQMQIEGAQALSKDKYLTRLYALNLEMDKERVTQEIALLIVKQDVKEELDRLAIHAKEVAMIIEGQQEMGRRLDFLMQELHREANTLNAKSDDLLLTQLAIEMKVLIEQMREQIQNLE